ncbi:MAG: lipoprotein, partial [Mangrovibacterium sp.]
MKKVILFSLAVAALASCSKENSPIEEGEKEIGTLSVAASFGISVEEENAF